MVSTFSDSGHPEIAAISRKDCLENPWVFLLPIVILFEHFILKEQECDKHLLVRDLFDLFSVFGPKIEASTKFKWQLFPVQGGSYQ